MSSSVLLCNLQRTQYLSTINTPCVNIITHYISVHNMCMPFCEFLTDKCTCYIKQDKKQAGVYLLIDINNLR